MKIRKMDPILKILDNSEEYIRLTEAIAKKTGPISVFGLGVSHKAHFTACLYKRHGGNLLYVTANESASSELFQELSTYFKNVYVFSAKTIALSAHTYAQSKDLAAKRLQLLLRLISGEESIVIASINALMQCIIPKYELSEYIYEFEIGDTIEINELLDLLNASGYERSDVCEGKGQFCVRGGYIDIYPITSNLPIRIELFDNEIDTMRYYDPLSQRSTENTNKITISPATETPLSMLKRRKAAVKLKNAQGLSSERELLEQGIMPSAADNLIPYLFDKCSSILEYISNDAIIILDEPNRIEDAANIEQTLFFESLSTLMLEKAADKRQEGLIWGVAEIMNRLNTPKTIMLFSLTRSYSTIPAHNIFSFKTRGISQYSTNMKLLSDDLAHWKRNGYSVTILAGKNASRLKDELFSLGHNLPVLTSCFRTAQIGEQIIVAQSLARGFEYIDSSYVVISEAELYGVIAKKSSKKLTPKRSFLNFSELNPGDFIVHEQYGIGRFVGMETITVDGVVRDYIRLSYHGSDALLIPTDQLDCVQKYIGTGADDICPKLSKLDSHEWQNTVSRTRESVKKLAFDLVKLYGERSQKTGFKYSPDNHWQLMMESSFPYTETVDQLNAISEIKADMEQGKVMDRLLCGDVGFGKTEVALRIAFKAIMDSKQVMFLVPTTVLAQQHYNTALARFRGFPVEVRIISRFCTNDELKKTLRDIELGTADLIIGTHRVLSKDVKYRDLGLMIIDEEQRFGVGHKEQIKELKKDIDVLTLTATPIPRTLHMSLSGVRDMSLIETPPEERYPVQTYVIEESPRVIREAVLKEMARGGQVFLLYNRVNDMPELKERISELIPEARIAYAHGQMPERLLEQTMLSFMEGEQDVLICSTIIENGIDIPNVNTIIVFDADRLGLSQLYQLRGRVGRSTRIAYAYLMFAANKVLTSDAEKRLKAIGEFTQFGSGFRLAMRDLEIRGAGNLLGPEQHGFMAAIGYDFYCKLINEAIMEAKGEDVPENIETSVSIPINANIPHTYIQNAPERMAMYRRIAMVGGIEDVQDIQDELFDRYGDIPQSVQNLLDIALIRSEAKKAYIKSINVNIGELRMEFSGNAPLKTERLLRIVQKTKGARMINGKEPALLIRQKNASVKSIKNALLQIVHGIYDCIEHK